MKQVHVHTWVHQLISPHAALQSQSLRFPWTPIFSNTTQQQNPKSSHTFVFAAIRSYLSSCYLSLDWEGWGWTLKLPCCLSACLCQLAHSLPCPAGHDPQPIRRVSILNLPWLIVFRSYKPGHSHLPPRRGHFVFLVQFCILQLEELHTSRGECRDSWLLWYLMQLIGYLQLDSYVFIY